MSEKYLNPSKPLIPLVRRGDILLTEDDKLRAYANHPTEKYAPKCNNDQVAFDDSSLLDLCEYGQKYKTKVLTFFHDHFFGGGERELHLMHPEFIDCTEKIAKFAEGYGIGIGASVTNPLELDVEDMSIDGRKVTYHGKGLCQFRFDEKGNLIGFMGDNTTGITIDGIEYNITENISNTVFNKLEESRLPDGYTDGWIICSDAENVNIYNDIPDTAEFYNNPDLVTNQLFPAPDVTATGSVIFKGKNENIVILIK